MARLLHLEALLVFLVYFVVSVRSVDPPFTYFIHASCDPYPQVPEALAEVKRMGKIGTRRVNFIHPADDALSDAFLAIMKVRYGNRDRSYSVASGTYQAFPHQIYDCLTPQSPLLEEKRSTDTR